MRFVVEKDERFFTAMLFAVKRKLVLVEHWKDKLIKIPGGTYFSKKELSLSKRELDEYYDNFNQAEVTEKLKKVIRKTLGDNVITTSNINILFLAEILVERHFENKPALHVIIEMIEETGIIPVVITEFHQLANGIQKFFFVCTKAIAFSKTQGKFIDIYNESDIPVRNRDFQNQDPDIKKNLVLNFDQIKEKIKEDRVNRHHVGVIQKYFESQVD